MKNENWKYWKIKNLSVKNIPVKLSFRYKREIKATRQTKAEGSSPLDLPYRNVEVNFSTWNEIAKIHKT